MYLTRDKADYFVFSPKADSVIVRAPESNTGSNSRVWFWRKDAPFSANQQSCATFGDSPWPTQEGVVLRLRIGNGEGRGITVMKNVFGDPTPVFNVHVWDTSKPVDGGRFTLVSSSDMSAVLSASSYPWSMCARVVGSEVTFKVWPANQATPSWNDTTHVRSTTLPPGWGAPGVPGIYVGHVSAGRTATFSGLSTEAL